VIFDFSPVQETDSSFHSAFQFHSLVYQNGEKKYAVTWLCPSKLNCRRNTGVLHLWMPCYDVQHYAYDLIVCLRTRPCTALLSSREPWHKTRSKWCRLHWRHPHKWQGTSEGGTWTTSAHRWDNIFYSWMYKWSEFLATDPEVKVRFPVLTDFLRSSGTGTGSTQLCEYKWGATWWKK
jgi:hypothetical protein